MRKLISLSTSRFLSLSALGAAFAVAFAVAPADATPIDFGAAGPGDWAILAVGTSGSAGKITINNESSLVDLGSPASRSLGIVGTGKLQMSGDGSFNGAARLGDGGTIGITSGNVISGGIFGHSLSGNAQGNTLTDSSQNSPLTQSKLDALAASSAANALATSSAFTGITSITTTQTLEGGAGVNVLHLTDLILGNGVTLTLDGNGILDSSFVINVSDEFKLNSAIIMLAGGLEFDDVVVNLIGTGKDVAFAGGGNAAQMTGIILAPQRKVSFSPGALTGMIIGTEVSLVSGADLNIPVVDELPEPSPLALLGFGLLGLVLVARFRPGAGNAAT